MRARIAESKKVWRVLLRNRGLRRLQLAFAGSIFGQWGFAVPLAAWAFDRRGTRLVAAAFIRVAPTALAAPFTSALADRFPRQRGLFGCEASRAA